MESSLDGAKSQDQEGIVEKFDDDNWSRQVQADPNDRGILSTQTSSVLDRDGDGDTSVDEQCLHGMTGSGDNDDDDDDWSRQVETDDMLHQAPSSVLDELEHTGVVASAATTGSITSLAPDEGLAVAPPHREEPTLKEKLVERERQRRAETERARLKRQFALRNGGHEESLAEEEEGSENDEDDHRSRENGSVAGTVGDGSVVAPVELLEDDAHKLMNYQMERFLQEQGTILEEENTREPLKSGKRDPQNQGVLMERFLQQPVVVDASPFHDQSVENDRRPAHVDRSVSFETDPPHTPIYGSPRIGLPPTSIGGQTCPDDMPTPPREMSQSSFHEPTLGRFDRIVTIGVETPRERANHLANDSMDCVTSEATRISSDLGGPEASTPDLTVEGGLRSSPVAPDVSEMPPESPLTDQPRVLGLTQAEIEELAAIEDVSQQNAPPSERDDLSTSSFVAELVSDFGGAAIDHMGATTLSQGTPTTAMESVSMLSGNQSAHPTVSENADDQHSLGELGTASTNSQILDASSPGASISVTANPPSELGNEDTPLSPIPDLPTSREEEPMSIDDRNESQLSLRTSMPVGEDGNEDLSDLATLNAGVVNRQIRPGVVNVQNVARRSGSPVRRVMSVPAKMDFDLDGFDYDKDAPASPPTGLFSTTHEPSAEMWSPGSRFSPERSPFRTQIGDELQPQFSSSLDYGATERTLRKSNGMIKHGRPLDQHGTSETEPLVIPDIPSEIVTNSRAAQLMSVNSINSYTIRSMMDDVFNDVRGENAAVFTLQKHNTQKYMRSSLLKRAFSGRLVSLCVSLILEIPVLVTVSGGSDRLCSLVGRSSYHILMGVLPLCCAISGNAGLQSSALTFRGVSTGLVTIKNFGKWLRREIGTTAILGLGTGMIVGTLTYIMSGGNYWLGVSVMVAQWISIVAAGVTGCVAPIFFTFFLEHDADKWTGLMITSIQDIVANFAMVVVAFRLFEYLGPLTTDPTDSCPVS